MYQKAEQENLYQDWAAETENHDEFRAFPSHARGKYGDLSYSTDGKAKKHKLFQRKKKFHSDSKIDPKQAQVQEVIKQTKHQIAEYTKYSKELPHLPKYTPEVTGHAVQYEISEIDVERKDRFNKTLDTFISGLRDVVKATDMEIMAMCSSGFNKLKNVIRELVDHEQKLRFLIIQLTKDISAIQMMMSSTDSSQKTNVGLLTEKLLQNTRQLQSTSELLERLNLKQRHLFVLTMKEMAEVYNTVLEFWKQIHPNSEEIQQLKGPLATEIESYEYTKPLTATQMDGTVVGVQLVKSHIWVAFRSGHIRIFSRSNASIPLFRSLKSFGAHETAICEILYIQKKNGISASVWTSSENGEVSIWNPDTGNNIYTCTSKEALKCMRVVPKGKEFTIWACSSDTTPIVSIWDPKVRDCLSLLSY